MLLDEHLDDKAMLLEARQTHLVDVTQFALFDQFHEEPERQVIRAVHEELSHKEVHALHVVSLVVVAREGSKHFSKLPLPSVTGS